MKKLLIKFGVTDSESFFALVKQFFKFGVVGVSNTLITLFTYYLLVHFGAHYMLANCIGFFLGICNAFFWNSRYVFTSKNDNNADIRQFIKTFIAYGGTLLLSTALLFVLVDIWGISQWMAPLVIYCVTIPVNFLLNKLWAFKE